MADLEPNFKNFHVI